MWLQAKECQRLSANHSRRDEGGFSQRTAGTGALPEPVFEIPNLQNFGKTAYAGLSHLAWGVCCRLPGMDPLFCPVLSSPGLQVHAVLCPGSWLRQSKQTQLTSSWVWLGGPRHVYWGWVTYLRELPACEVSWAHCVSWSRNLDKIHYLMLLKTDERLSDWTELETNERMQRLNCLNTQSVFKEIFQRWG